MKIISSFLLSLCFAVTSSAQYNSKLPVQQWVDSVFNSLTPEQRIAQLMVIRAHSNLGADHIAKVTNDIKQYNIGALCFFQGGPLRQAKLTNFYQGIAQTPLMITIDGEWGLGMRLDSVTKFPFQLTLGAMDDQNLVYRMGIAVGEQCKRIGIHVNYAPVVDINNNPNNPVIGYRSFGEDKIKVAALGVAYMKGMQDAGIMACAKHFPGHGDVDVDSHFDLPVVNKSLAELDSLELVPFRAVFDAGIGSAMIAHLFIPAIDNTANKATSISKNLVTGILRDKMNYKGLTFTDALEMQGVAKFFPDGTIAVEALIAGNDMLCLPASVPETIEAVKKAIAQNRLTWDDINTKVKKVLQSKYKLGLNKWLPIDTNNLLDDLNAKTDAIREEVARKSITVLSLASQKASRNDYATIPLKKDQKIAYLGIGSGKLNGFGKRLKESLDAEVFLFSYTDGAKEANEILKKLQKDGKYDAIIVGITDFNIRPANNYGITAAAIDLWKKVNFIKTETFVFGNVLATSNFCDGWTLVACYQDDDITYQAAFDLLEGKLEAKGKLPVSVCHYKYGDGIVFNSNEKPGYDPDKLVKVDSIVYDAIGQKAFPGCVVLAVHNGEVIYHKAFGNYRYEGSSPMSKESIFDLASLTKVSATTVAIMKLYEQGKIELDKRLADYLPQARSTDKADLTIHDLLLHQAGLVPDVLYYKYVRDSASHKPNPAILSEERPGFSIRVADNLYLRNDWLDTAFQLALDSKLSRGNKYVYSDVGFILLGKVVESVTNMPLHEYLQNVFYSPIGMRSTGFKPRERFSLDQIVPTEVDSLFRGQLLWGDVHDYSASVFGGEAGHAGLFSNAYDLGMLYQMLLNGGEFNGVRYLKPETIKLFTKYSSNISRRGLGFDKPEKDNTVIKESSPSKMASSETFGHTGFTGNCVWVDPKYKLIYIFLSNAVYPSGKKKFTELSIRPKIQDVIYEALGI